MRAKEVKDAKEAKEAKEAKDTPENKEGAKETNNEGETTDADKADKVAGSGVVHDDPLCWAFDDRLNTAILAPTPPRPVALLTMDEVREFVSE